MGTFIHPALPDRINRVISGPREIFRNGQNWIKIFYSDRIGANLLVLSPDLRNFGCKVYISPSLIQKRAFPNGIPSKYSCLEIVNKISPMDQAKIMVARRRMKKDGSTDKRVEFVFPCSGVPRCVAISNVAFNLTLVIPFAYEMFPLSEIPPWF